MTTKFFLTAVTAQKGNSERSGAVYTKKSRFSIFEFFCNKSGYKSIIALKFEEFLCKPNDSACFFAIKNGKK